MVAYDATEPPLMPLRVLLIDGNGVDRDFLSRSIAGCGAGQVHACQGVAEALNHLGATQALPHIVFADLALPDLPALEMMHWIRCRGEFASVWLVAITADMKLATRPAEYYGADALLVKPVSLHDLAAVLALSANTRSGTRLTAPAAADGR